MEKVANTKKNTVKIYLKTLLAVFSRHAVQIFNFATIFFLHHVCSLILRHCPSYVLSAVPVPVWRSVGGPLLSDGVGGGVGVGEKPPLRGECRVYVYSRQPPACICTKDLPGDFLYMYTLQLFIGELLYSWLSL